jgi:hypothetical protein
MDRDQVKGCLLVAVVLGVGIGLFWAVHWGSTPPKDPPGFTVGQTVRIRLDGGKATVLRLTGDKRSGWIVHCRIGLLGQHRRDGLVSKDTEVVAYSVVKFRPFELEDWDERKDFPLDGGEG